MSNQLRCSQCLEEYRRPRVLPCLHVFCEACLEKLAATQRDTPSVRCPSCRESVSLPAGGVTALPPAFYIQHLMETREVLEKVRDPGKAECDKCGEVEVRGFCRDCSHFVCQLCLDVHQRWREFKTHEMCSLDEVGETAMRVVTPKKVFCSKHSTEPVKIYCETCDELTCYDCAIKTHRDHSYDLITDAFPKQKEALLACLGPLKSELTRIGGTIVQLNARSSRLDGQGLEAKAQVDDEVHKLQTILEAHRRQLHSEIDGKVCQGKKELAVDIDRHETRQSQLRGCVEFVEGSLECGTREEVLSMKAHMERRTHQVAKEFKPHELELGTERRVCVVCNDLSSAFTTLGHVRFEAKFDGTHVMTIGGINHPCHAAFAATGEMVVCEWNANRVRVYDKNHRHLRSFGRKGARESRLEEPLGVAISPNSRVFIAACHCVKKYTLEGEFIAAVGSEGSKPEQFHTPFAIAYNHTNDRLYVCDTVNNRIKILNTDLTLHGIFGCAGREAGQLNMPEGIAADGRGNVLVADHLNNRVQIFDANGVHISCITHSEPDQRLQGPISVAVGAGDSVYVMENYSNRVSLFNERGKFVKSFGRRGSGVGEFDDPYAVAVKCNGHVYVSDTHNDRIQVFK